GPRLFRLPRPAVRVRDEDGGEPLTLARNPGYPYLSVGQTRHGPWIAVAAPKPSLYMLDQAGRVRRTVDLTDKGYLNDVAVSPDGTRLAMVGGAPVHKEFKVYDVASGTELRAFHGHDGWIHGLAFSPDGTQIASASEDGTARVWNAATGAETAVLRGHSVKVLSVAFRPDGARVLT